MTHCLKASTYVSEAVRAELVLPLNLNNSRFYGQHIRARSAQCDTRVATVFNVYLFFLSRSNGNLFLTFFSLPFKRGFEIPVLPTRSTLRSRAVRDNNVRQRVSVPCAKRRDVFAESDV